jgi:hypothetical protein
MSSAKYTKETNRSLNLGSNPVFIWSDCGRAQKTSVRTAVVLADTLNHASFTDSLSLEPSCSVHTIYCIDRYQLSRATCFIFPHGRCYTFQLFLRNKSWVVKWSCRPASCHTLLPGTKYASIHIWTPANGDKWATANFRQALSLVLPTQNQICKYGNMWGWGEQLKRKFIGLSILTVYRKMSCLTKTHSNTKGSCEKFCCVSWPHESNPFSNLFLYRCFDINFECQILLTQLLNSRNAALIGFAVAFAFWARDMDWSVWEHTDNEYKVYLMVNFITVYNTTIHKWSKNFYRILTIAICFGCYATIIRPY